MAVATLGAIVEAEETLPIDIDFGRVSGKIRRLNGTNLAAPLTSVKVSRDIGPDLKALDIPIVRFHDASLENAGMQLVDVSRVFPLFDLDPENPAHYDFAQTDDYLAGCAASGTKMSYRLGESIEWSAKQYRVHPPKDFDKWADICIGIIRHYNEGWANGFHHNIEYWCIWEEPENVPPLWTGTWDDYVRLYVTAAKKIKSRFPNLKVGGPAMGVPQPALVKRLLAECKRQDAPLDFFAANNYSPTPKTLIVLPETLRKMLDDNGFHKTELHVTEWNYFPGQWEQMGDPAHRAKLDEAMGGPDGAAFICAVLSGWQDTSLDMGFFYVGTALSNWGLFRPPTRSRKKNYYGMLAFAEMARYEQRVSASNPGHDTWVLAGRKPDGQAAALVSCFKGPAARIQVRVEGGPARPARVRVIDAQRDLVPIPVVVDGERAIVLEKPAGSAVFLVEWPGKGTSGSSLR
jgi:xylan 1,4-beta-xylosidase